MARDYHAGAPELVIEVGVSSHARDFGAKKRLDEKMGVGEYLIVLPREQDMAAFSIKPAGFQKTDMDGQGIFRSVCFSGLWLATKALWRLDIPQMMAVLEQGWATAEQAKFAERLAAQKRQRLKGSGALLYGF